jgi:hypothetical protein
VAAGHFAQRVCANLNDMPRRLLLEIFHERLTAPRSLM